MRKPSASTSEPASPTRAAAAQETPFATTFAHFLRSGYALLPPQRTDSDCERQEHQPEVGASWESQQHAASTDIDDSRTLIAGCERLLDALRRDDLAKGEQVCGAMVRDETLSCFQLVSRDHGMPWVRQKLAETYWCFFNEKISGVSIHSYIAHLLKYMRCPYEVSLFAGVYIARVVQAGIPFTARSAHRLVLAALVVAVKLRDEPVFSMQYYSRIGGVTPSTLCELELALLKILNYRTSVSPAIYVASLFSLRSCHAQLSGRAVGAWMDVVKLLALPQTAEPGTAIDLSLPPAGLLSFRSALALPVTMQGSPALALSGIDTDGSPTANSSFTTILSQRRRSSIESHASRAGGITASVTSSVRNSSLTSASLRNDSFFSASVPNSNNILTSPPVGGNTPMEYATPSAHKAIAPSVGGALPSQHGLPPLGVSIAEAHPVPVASSSAQQGAVDENQNSTSSRNQDNDGGANQ